MNGPDFTSIIQDSDSLSILPKNGSSIKSKTNWAIGSPCWHPWELIMTLSSVFKSPQFVTSLSQHLRRSPMKKLVQLFFWVLSIFPCTSPSPLLLYQKVKKMATNYHLGRTKVLRKFESLFHYKVTSQASFSWTCITCTSRSRNSLQCTPQRDN